MNILIGLVYPPECMLTLSYRANNNLYDNQQLVDDFMRDVNAYKDGAQNGFHTQKEYDYDTANFL